MHIPPFFKKRHWQWLIIGCCVGGIVSYAIFIYMNGIMYEKLLEENMHLQAEVTELKNRNESLLEDQRDFDEQSSKLMTIEKIEVHIYNDEDMDFDRLETLHLEELIKREVNHIIGKNIMSVAENDQLLVTSIENKPYKVGDFFYYFHVYRLTIANTVKITVQARLSKDA